MAAPSHRMVRTNGIQMHVVEQGEGPLVVLCHGFPELSHSWRHQLGALTDAGYRVVVPDMRGYGATERPSAVEAYDILQLTGDLVGLLDALGADQATFVGHDWGAVVVWNLAVLAPERVRAVAGLSVPFTPRGERDPISAMEFLFKDRFFYILYFQSPGVADAELAADVEQTFRRLLRDQAMALDHAAVGPERPRASAGFLDALAPPGPLPAWLSEEDLDVYVATFTETGFTGGLNWYRNLRRNWELTAHVADWTVRMPALFLTGSDDPVRRFMTDAHLDRWVPELRANVLLEGAGHWVQQERAAEVNEALLGFLGSLD
ncbi:MAG TPA: alpha/beta hydrolase [Acidimicrobiales bacterium]|jgi:pimeloyl-ACP methyl ester carboxylesterase|nr:alpha/beta hydrolase [Acidimicrobiales bacterium]